MDNTIFKTITKTLNIRFKKCSHSEEINFNINTEKDYENYLDIMKDGINDYCPKCRTINYKYGMEKVLYSGDYDSSKTMFIFNHSNIKQVIRYCYEMEIPLHDEHFDINSPYDCTGQLCSLYVKVKKFKKHITVRVNKNYDL